MNSFELVVGLRRDRRSAGGGVVLAGVPGFLIGGTSGDVVGCDGEFLWCRNFALLPGFFGQQVIL